jgi:hypothetical protein
VSPAGLASSSATDSEIGPADGNVTSVLISSTPITYPRFPSHPRRKPGEAPGAWLTECEEEAVEALQEAIEPTGREGRSEALEHMLGHLIMRKQHQIDFLRRAAAS